MFFALKVSLEFRSVYANVIYLDWHSYGLPYTDSTELTDYQQH